MEELNKKQLELLEEKFIVVEENEKIECVENWTNGGVDMIIYIEEDKGILESITDYVDNFDIDEEIDMYRQDKSYKNNFTITESIKDFQDWLQDIKDIITKIESEA